MSSFRFLTGEQASAYENGEFHGLIISVIIPNHSEARGNGR
jgi:hypothetical protein